MSVVNLVKSGLLFRLQRMWASQYSKYFLLAALVAAIIANLMDVKVFGFGPINPAAVSALGAWFSGMLTVIAITIAAKTFDRNRQKDDEQALRDACAVFAWLEICRDKVTAAPQYLVLHMANQTEVPIYQWKLVLEGFPALQCSSATNGPILPGTTELELMGDDWVRVARKGVGVRVGLEFGTSTGTTMHRLFDGSLATPKEYYSATLIEDCSNAQK